ncbi:YlbE family protein [Mycolicibacterium arseniciresistens]|uniref:DUF1116 domain-containing protein n=1 Tax=Mycolicibacterium arseniciresistens TaxID=3062257 RepID=A0ABT8UED8_9MYCO|nr:DUF1116 domain-containing protein [Mycolicibacterium arseniciresistens]MDO3636152.1 DUF1116 domain-containing protein [Mycolicibacterium arseniciresistens]
MTVSMPAAPTGRPAATPNDVALDRVRSVQPVLVDVAPAIDVVPGLRRRMILTSGPTMPWSAYRGGQRTAVLGAAVNEGLAADLDVAADAFAAGDIEVAGCQDHGCIGSLAGVTSASMPVVVVEDATTGERAFCTLFEGETPHRLNYGVWNDAVRENLRFLADVIGPALGAAIRRTRGIPLLPIMARALRQGDELHSRNTAASLLLLREIVPALHAGAAENEALVGYLTTGDYFFLRPAMAAAKLLANAAAGVPGSSIVTSMAMSCTQFGITVSGLGDTWFTGPLPGFDHYKLTGGHTIDDAEFMGGESIITEAAGLGAFAQTSAFTLQDYQGGVDAMIAANADMYRICHGESPHFSLPYFGFRGSPAGIDVHRVVGTGVTPVMDIGIAGRAGGQIGAGMARAPLEPFAAASAALNSNPVPEGR